MYQKLQTCAQKQPLLFVTEYISEVLNIDIGTLELLTQRFIFFFWKLNIYALALIVT